MALSTTYYEVCPETIKFFKIAQHIEPIYIRAISRFKVIQGHRIWYQSKAHVRLPIKTIARQVLRIKS